MKRLAAFMCLIAALALADDRLQPRDLTPVTWLESPRHAPVEIVREGKPVAVVYVADPEGRRDWLPGEWYLPKSLVPRVWTPEIVEPLKTLRDRALVELADDPVARQRLLHWTWTFDAFVKEATGGNK